MKISNDTIMRYSSRKGNATINRSFHHEGMWIVNFSDGTFISVNTDLKHIVQVYPPDDKKLLLLVK